MGERALHLSLREEHVEVSVLHVLRHHAQRVGGHAHAQQPDDVGVVQAGHDLDFLQEVAPKGRGSKGHMAVGGGGTAAAAGGAAVAAQTWPGWWRQAAAASRPPAPSGRLAREAATPRPGTPGGLRLCTGGPAGRGGAERRRRYAQQTRARGSALAAHLSELPLPQLLPEDQLLTRELGGRDVLPGEGVHGEGGNGVHVAARHALQPDDVRLGVVRRAAVEALVRRALGDVRLGVASSAGCRREEEEERLYFDFFPVLLASTAAIRVRSRLPTIAVNLGFGSVSKSLESHLSDLTA